MTGLEFLAELARWSVLMAFAAAAWGKVRGLRNFAESLSESFGWSERAATRLARTVVGAEISSVVLMAAGGLATSIGLVGASGLLIIFTALIANALVRDTTFVCSCFGDSKRPVTRFDLIRNLCLLGCAAVALAIPSQVAFDLASGLVVGALAITVVLFVTQLQEVSGIFAVDIDE